MQCRGCGKENENGNLFCVFCGKPLKENECNEVPTNFIVETYQSEPKAEVYQPESHMQSNVNPPKEKKKKSKMPLIIGFLLICLIGVGALLYTSPQKSTKDLYAEDYVIDNIVGFIYTDWDNDLGDLYIQPVGGEKQVVANGIGREHFVYSIEEKVIAYVDAKGDLYVMPIGQGRMLVKSNVIPSSLSIVGRYLALTEESSGDELSSYVYDLRSQQLLLSIKNTFYSWQIEEGSNWMSYITRDEHTLYMTNNKETRKIASNVYDYVRINEHTYLCNVGDNEDSQHIVYYVTEGKIREEIIENMDYIVYKPDYIVNQDKAIYFPGKASSSDEYSLYVKLQGQQPIELAGDITDYSFEEENGLIYYTNTDGEVYSMKMPEINKKCLNDSRYLEKKLENVQHNLIAQECNYFQASPDKKSLLIYTEDETYFYQEGTTVTLSEDAEYLSLFNDYIVYSTDNNELYIQEKKKEKDKITLEEPILIADNLLDDYTTTPYGSLIMYNTEYKQNGQSLVSMNYYSKEDGHTVVLNNADVYDYVQVGYMNYNRVLKQEEVVGVYICRSDHFMVRIEEDGRFIAYAKGVEQGSVMPEYEGSTRNSLGITNNEDAQSLEIETISSGSYFDIDVLGHRANLTLSMNGECEIDTWNGYIYTLEPISEVDFAHYMDEQKYEEEKMQAQEQENRRRQALDDAAYSYYYDGVQLSSGTPIYEEHSYSATQYYSTGSSQYWSVQDVYVDYDQSIIWLKIQHFPNNGGGSSRYGWVAKYN